MYEGTPKPHGIGCACSECSHLDRACELLWQAGHPRIAEALAEEVTALRADRDRLHALLVPVGATNRKQRRAERHGAGLSAQLDDGPRQGG